MSICRKCIIPGSFPNIEIDDSVCTFCKIHEAFPRVNKEPLGRPNLIKLLASAKSCRYDCVVGLSGGKDSSYLTYYLVKELGLNPLLVFYNNGFISNYAIENINNICRRLNLDLVEVKASKYRLRLMRENIYLSKFTNKIDVCVNCENNLRTSVINEATKRNISYIVYGATDYEDPYKTFLNSATPTFRSTRSKENYNLIRTIKRLKWEYVDPLHQPMKLLDKTKYYYHYFLSKFYVVCDNIQMKSPEGLKNLNPSMHVTFDGKSVKSLYFFDYLEYHPKKMVDILKKEIGWVAPNGREARMDCKLGCFANLQHLRKTGITKDGFTLSVLVRNGLMSREEALRKEEILKENLQEECEEVISKILEMNAKC